MSYQSNTPTVPPPSWHAHISAIDIKPEKPNPKPEAPNPKPEEASDPKTEEASDPKPQTPWKVSIQCAKEALEEDIRATSEKLNTLLVLQNDMNSMLKYHDSKKKNLE